MSSASDIFRRVAKRHRTLAGDTRVVAEVAEAMKKEEFLIQELWNIHQLCAQEDSRHALAIKQLKAKRAEVQKNCQHEFSRATAECEPVCSICGYEDDGRGGYAG